MNSYSLGLRIFVRGKPITEYLHEGRTFVEGRQDTPYEIEIANRHPSGRVAVVLSVDGLSVMDGKLAGPDSGAYILDRSGTVSIPGWKLNGMEAAKFVFGSGSYAKQMTGSSANNGVIGAIFYAERVVQPRAISPLDTKWRTFGEPMMKGPMRTLRSGSGGYSRSQENNIGTEFGEATDFRTQTVSFQRAAEIGRVELYYDDAKGLRIRGIEVGRAVDVSGDLPNAFPAEGCQPPPGWQGKA